MPNQWPMTASSMADCAVVRRARDESLNGQHGKLVSSSDASNDASQPRRRLSSSVLAEQRSTLERSVSIAIAPFRRGK